MLYYKVPIFISIFLSFLATTFGFSQAIAEEPKAIYHVDRWQTESPRLPTTVFAATDARFIVPIFNEGDYDFVGPGRGSVRGFFYNFDFVTGELESSAKYPRGKNSVLLNVSTNCSLDKIITCKKETVKGNLQLIDSLRADEFAYLGSETTKIDESECITAIKSNVICYIFGVSVENKNSKYPFNGTYFYCKFLKDQSAAGYACKFYNKSPIGLTSIHKVYFGKAGFNFESKSFNYDRDRILADAHIAHEWSRKITESYKKDK